MSEIVEKLHSYELFTFQSRIFNKVPDEEQTTEQPETLPPWNVPSDVENTQTYFRKVQPIQGAYILRGRTIIKSIIPKTKFENLTFKHFFPRLLKTFKHLDLTLRMDSFKTQVNLFLREKVKIFFKQIPKIWYKVFRLLSQKKEKLVQS
jgi:hypothetical protein